MEALQSLLEIFTVIKGYKSQKCAGICMIYTCRYILTWEPLCELQSATQVVLWLRNRFRNSEIVFDFFNIILIFCIIDYYTFHAWYTTSILARLYVKMLSDYSRSPSSELEIKKGNIKIYNNSERLLDR